MQEGAPEQKQEPSAEQQSTSEARLHRLSIDFVVKDNVLIGIKSIAGAPENISIWKAMIGYADAEMAFRYVVSRIEETASRVIPSASPAEVERELKAVKATRSGLRLV